MPYVNSTAIHRIEYDRETRRMEVWFQAGGRPYSFCGVPEGVYRAFLASSSKGVFYADNIRDRYRC